MTNRYLVLITNMIYSNGGLMKTNLMKIAFHYLEMSAMFMLLAMSNGTEKLDTIKKVLEADERENKGFNA